MFNKKTVFILGAGASWHYGYPTGEELVRLVKEKAEEVTRRYRTPDGDGRVPQGYPGTYPRNFKADSFDPFLQRLSYTKNRISEANPLVIDDFLGRNDDIADVGKLLIALVLFDCEKKQQIRPRKYDDKRNDIGDKGDWVRYIVQQLTVDCEAPEYLLRNDVTFVTFNYDLSLERRLHAALKNYEWFAKDGYSDKFFARGRFHHVYGALYDFDPAHPNGPEIAYRNESFPLAADIDSAHDAAQKIKTIAPGKLGRIDTSIPSAIVYAQYLYFLGYGFDRRNNELLELGKRPDGANKQAVYFTNFGNHNKVSKSVDRTFFPPVMDMDFQIDERKDGELVGDRYRKMSSGWDVVKPRWYCEKSINSVYDALAQDFNWPG